MTNKERRQIIYAALLRFTPEMEPLRDRVLDRIVLVALIGSSRKEPYSVRKLNSQIAENHQSRRLRPDVVELTLNRLIDRDKVKIEPIGSTDSYCLTDNGSRDVDKATQTASEMFAPVLKRMLSDTDHLFDFNTGTAVCRSFISECFARFGQRIAETVVGAASNNSLAQDVDAKRAFRAAIEHFELSSEAVESLRARCVRFLTSTERSDVELKFRLTQGYYVAQLLSIDAYNFNPLSKDSYCGATIYIDTNVLITRLLSEEGARLFDELVRICNSLGITLAVSRATINETRRVATSRVSDIDRILTTVSGEVARRTKDIFLDAFLEEQVLDPNLTTNGFLARFDNISSLLEQLEIDLDDRTAKEVIGNRMMSRERDIIQAAAERVRGSRKSEMVCDHDICHYVIVSRLRAYGRKAWFLTRDKTLFQASKELTAEKPPFCLPFTAFVHSVSPFVEAPEAHHTLVDLFSALLQGQIGDLTGTAFFDIEELKVMLEYHSDIFSLADERIIPAIDFVKNTVLRGKPIQREDHPRVALELRKHIISSTDKKVADLQSELRTERELRKSEIEKIEKSRKAAESKIVELEAGVEKEKHGRKTMQDEKLQLEERLRVSLEEKKRLKENIEKERLGVANDKLKRSIWHAVFAAITALALWNFDSSIVMTIFRSETIDAMLYRMTVVGVRVLGAALLIVFSWRALVQVKWSGRDKCLGVIVGVALAGVRVFSDVMVSEISGYLAIGVVLAGIFWNQRRPHHLDRDNEE